MSDDVNLRSEELLAAAQSVLSAGVIIPACRDDLCAQISKHREALLKERRGGTEAPRDDIGCASSDNVAAFENMKQKVAFADHRCEETWKKLIAERGERPLPSDQRLRSAAAHAAGAMERLDRCGGLGIEVHQTLKRHADDLRRAIEGVS